eukprot:1968476-Rhodomonas_salina.3
MGRDAGAKAAAEAMIANKHAERSIADPLRGHITAADSNSKICTTAKPQRPQLCISIAGVRMVLGAVLPEVAA